MFAVRSARSNPFQWGKHIGQAPKSEQRSEKWSSNPFQWGKHIGHRCREQSQCVRAAQIPSNGESTLDYIGHSCVCAGRSRAQIPSNGESTLDVLGNLLDLAQIPSNGESTLDRCEKYMIYPQELAQIPSNGESTLDYIWGKHIGLGETLNEKGARLAQIPSNGESTLD
jgi:hypothetical protein